MNSDPSAAAPACAPIGLIEPHAGLLTAPAPGQRLYKLLTVENLLRSIAGGYLHFNRVDAYADFPGADPFDGSELPGDQPANASTEFEKAPTFSLSDYYARSRGRTFACCFSLDNSAFIWTHYGLGSPRGQICLEIDFNGLRQRLNRTLGTGNSALECNGVRCLQIFSINYGEVRYVPWADHRANSVRAPNPIEYAFLKDEQFRDERELRVTLSALGMGEFVLANGAKISFPPSLQMDFDLRQALEDGTIRQLLIGASTDRDFLRDELDKFGIGAVP